MRRVGRGRWRDSSRMREGWKRRAVNMLKGGFSFSGGVGDAGWWCCCSEKLRRPNGVDGGTRAGS